MLMNLVVLALSALIGANQSSKAAPGLPASAVTRAGWLVGCWHSTGKGVPNVRETWERASDGLLVGRFWKPAPGLLVEYVFLRIESAADGSLSIVTQNPGERPNRRALESSAGELKAEDLFYRKGKDDTMTMRRSIDGVKPADIPMKKEGCG